MQNVLLEIAARAALALFLTGSAAGWIAALLRLHRGQPIVRCAPRPPVPWGLIDLLLMFFIVGGLMYAAQMFVVSRWNIPLDGKLENLKTEQMAAVLLANSLATLVSCLVSMVLVRVRAGARLSDLGLVAAEFWNDVQLGGIAFVMLAPPMYFLQFVLTQIWPYKHPVQDLLLRQADASMLLVTLVAAVVVAPFAEEMFFRVLLQGWFENASVMARKSLGLTFGLRDVDGDELQRDWQAVMVGNASGQALLEPVAPMVEKPPAPIESPPSANITSDSENPYASPSTDCAIAAPAAAMPTAKTREFRPGYVPIVLSAAIFAGMHFGHGPAPIPLFFLAIGLGYLYRQTHRATPSIVVHLLINSVSMAVMWIGLSIKS